MKILEQTRYSSTTTTTITAVEKSHTRSHTKKIHFQFDFAFDLSRRLDWATQVIVLQLKRHLLEMAYVDELTRPTAYCLCFPFSVSLYISIIFIFSTFFSFSRSFPFYFRSP